MPGNDAVHRHGSRPIACHPVLWTRVQRNRRAEERWTSLPGRNLFLQSGRINSVRPCHLALVRGARLHLSLFRYP